MNLSDKKRGLVEERARVFQKMNELLEKARIGVRDLRPYEQEQLDKLEAEANSLTHQIVTIERLLEREPEPTFTRQIRDGGPHAAARAPHSFALDREQRVADWYVEARGLDSLSDVLEGERPEAFSLGRVVRGMVTGNWQDAELEQRVLGESTPGAGGFLTPEGLATTVIDRIRNQARVIAAGAGTVPVESDEYSIPRLATGVTGAWRNENTPVAESDPTFERVTFKVKTLAVLVRMSYELVMDLTRAGAEIIENELIQALALELDRAALRGTGTAPEPRCAQPDGRRGRDLRRRQRRHADRLHAADHGRVRDPGAQRPSQRGHLQRAHGQRSPR